MSLFIQYREPARKTRTLQALLLHESRHGPYGPPEYIFTSHLIEQTGCGPLIGAGHLITSEDHRLLLDALIGVTAGEESAYLPSEVLSSSATQLAWYVPAQVRNMWFRLGTRSVRWRVPWPTLVFRVRQGNLSLAAVAGRSRPQANARLYHSPLMNVHEDTRLCAGSASLPKTWMLKDRAGYESAVFEANFLHVNHPNTLRTVRNTVVTNADHVRFWRELAASGASRFPLTALVPLKTQLAGWLSE